MNGGAPRKVLVIGLGNPDRGDDGIGPRVARRLAGMLPPDVAIATPRGDLLGLLTEWDGFHAVICIDAAAPLTTPGRIHRFDLAHTELPPRATAQSSHALGLAETIALARALGQLPEEIAVYAIEGESFVAGTGITPQVASAGDEVADRIAMEIATMRWNCGGADQHKPIDPERPSQTPPTLSTETTARRF